MSYKVDIKELFAAGAHFGHKTARRHPKMSEFIHSKRGDSHIIDLTATVEQLAIALKKVETVVASGKPVLFVCTKPQTKDVVRAAAVEAGMPFVSERWLGGMLTNKKTMDARIKRLKSLEEKMESGELVQKYNKLEVQRFSEEIEGLNHKFGGIKDLNGVPGIVFVADITTDTIAVEEAKKLNVPVVGIADTNSNPTKIDYPIACNDDAIGAVKLIADYVTGAVKAGKAKQKIAPAETKKSESGK